MSKKLLSSKRITSLVLMLATMLTTLFPVRVNASANELGR